MLFAQLMSTVSITASYEVDGLVHKILWELLRMINSNQSGKVTSVKNGAMQSRERTARATMMNGNEKDDESALSPLVTAQERKRRILERRRKEKKQDGTTRLANAASMTAPAFGPNKG